ncbi:PREDICTED: remorin-like [Camelina sativa]|uniref:Remorin-like n=1 Tax=Camelina sativa TaxID=90675 RepID=A0ABM0SKU8_CAMSA|nr:PREDICTED: remorin-like [Camelina sativa]
MIVNVLPTTRQHDSRGAEESHRAQNQRVGLNTAVHGGEVRRFQTIVLVVAAKEAAEEKKEGSVHRDAVLVRLEQDKRISLIKAWEEAEKSKVENKAQKKLSYVGAWENSKKASVEAELKKIEEQLLKKKAEYAEKMKNKIARIHKEAEEKRAMAEAKRGEDVLKAEEMAAKYRATGTAPTKLFGLF